MMQNAAPTTSVGSAAEIPTPNASRYLQQLCKHFAHKLPVAFDEQNGRIAFTIGTCDLTAEADVLKMLLSAPDNNQMVQLQDVVARHLTRFAFREDIPVDWHAV